MEIVKQKEAITFNWDDKLLNIKTGHLKLGGYTPDGDVVAINSIYIEKNGMPWTPVMGEIHYSRLSVSEWKDRLMKMKACGIDIAATYVFWIHHQEKEDEAYNWAGNRNLREFIKKCKDAGLYVFLRIGPWAHGEVRNGGFPDYIAKKFGKTSQAIPKDRFDEYMEYVKAHYKQIAMQTEGLFFKDGGPIVGIQLDNEYYGGEQYLYKLKNLANEMGMQAPIYTVTGWGDCVFPKNEVIPVFGGYAEWSWMPYDYDLIANPSFHFSKVRNDTNIGTDLFGRSNNISDEYQDYPMITAEVGGGMQVFYERRPIISADDVASVAYCKIGSGSNLNGYYMFCGGTNPIGKYSSMQESKETGYSNDLPVFSYDFQAPIGEHGYIRDSYYELKKLHLFIKDFGSIMADMPTVLPEAVPEGIEDNRTLRCALRTDGKSGFVFINNYNKNIDMPDFESVSIRISQTDSDPVIFDDLKIKNKTYFFIPFNMDCGGIILRQAFAQPICKIDDIYIFSRINDNIPVFLFDKDVGIQAENFSVTLKEGYICVKSIQDCPYCTFTATYQNQSVRIMLLSQAEALKLWKGYAGGRERVFLAEANIMFDKNHIILTSESNHFEFGLYPFDDLHFNIRPDYIKREEVLMKYGFSVDIKEIDITTMNLGQGNYKVRMKKEDLEGLYDIFLEIEFAGDRIMMKKDGEIIDDQFWYGQKIYKSIKRYEDAIFDEGLEIECSDMEKGAKIYLEKEVNREKAENGKIVNIKPKCVYGLVL